MGSASQQQAPAPVWIPSPHDIQQSNLVAIISQAQVML